MRRLIIAPTAAREIDVLLATSEARFGAEAAERYRSLISLALRELLEEPSRVSARSHPELPAAIRLFHLRHISRRLPADRRVADPRHFLIFRYDDVVLEIVRVLHDAMDLPRRLERLSK